MNASLHKFYILRCATLFITLALLLSACTRTNTPAPEASPPTADAPQLRGLAQVTFSDLSLESNTLTSQVTFHPLPGPDGQALTNVVDSLQLRLTGNGSFSYGPAVTVGANACFGNFSTRFIYATFEVRNAAVDSTPYNVARNNLTFVAIDNNGSDYGDNAIGMLQKPDGSFYSPTDPDAIYLANCAKPSHQTSFDVTNGLQTVTNGADMQVFAEDEIANLGLIGQGDISNVFPYGYVVRNKAGGRTLAANPGPDQYDGVMTIAVRVPSISNFPSALSIWFYIYEDDTASVTEGLFEQGTTGAENRADALGATTPIRLLGKSPTTPTTNPTTRLCEVRTAGPAAAPTDRLINESGDICDFPDGRIYVDGSATGSNDGSSWTDAFTNLPDALAAARNDTTKEIWVVGGTYTPDEGSNATVVTTDTSTTPPTVNVTTSPADNNRRATFYITEGITLYGGFAGTEATRNSRDPVANPTILSGDIGAVNTPTDNSYHVLYLDGTSTAMTTATLIDGFTVTAGQADGSFADSLGGAVLVLNGSPTLTNVAFANNTAGEGGAMANLNGSPTLTNVAFADNTAGEGGALYNDNSNPRLINVALVGNVATNDGGALYNGNGSRPTLTNVTAANNSAASSGGALFDDDGSGATLVNTILWANRVGATPNQVFHSNTTANTLVISYSIVEGGANAVTGSGSQTGVNYSATNQDRNPLLVDLAAGDVRLLDCSPAIDAGDNTAISAPTDLAGNPRKVDDPNVTDTSAGTAPIADIGAFEVQDPSENCNVIRVDKNTTGNGLGYTWADAVPTLQDALAIARNSDRKEIWVAAGTYYPDEGATITDRTGSTGNADLRSATFFVSEGMEIYGGFAGGETNRSDRDPDLTTNVTTLSGDIDEDNAFGSNAYHVLYLDGSTTAITGATVIDRVSVTAGQANGSSFPDNVGGAMYNDNSSPTLTNVTFTGNEARGGGAMYNRSSSPTLTNVTFTGNEARGSGGAMFNVGSSPTLTDVTFMSNTASDDGGAMFNVGSSSPTLTDVTFSGNTAFDVGGAMYNTSSSSPTLTNVTFSDNMADDGGAIYNADGTTTLINSTITDNTATNQGGGIWTLGDSTTLTVLKNTIVLGNNASTEEDLYANDTTTPWDGSHNLIGDQDNTSFFQNGANGNIVDPSLTQAAVFVDAPNGNLRLAAGSPAIDAGDNAALPQDTADLDGDNDTTEQLPLDLDGNTRVVNGTVDMGAYEVQP